MPRPRTIVIGAFALLLAASPFLPRGGGDDGSLMPSGKQKYAATSQPALTATAGRVTPRMQTEIDRVVAQGQALGRLSGKASTTSLVDDLVRCADFAGQIYCLGSGWTESSPAQVRARTGAIARTTMARPVGATTRTGDLDVLATLQRSAALSPRARAAAETRELTDAARSVAKVWILRHQIEGVALPADFLATHPEARAATSPASTMSAGATAPATPAPTKRKTRRDYPRRATVLDPAQVAEQQRTYWCGPAAMQMIAWGWKQQDLGQTHWAGKLGTTTGGTGITDMVRVTNQNTGWDNKSHAGPYITLDIKNYTYKKWLLLTMRHIVDYRAPMIFHPILLKKYYPYLDDDASGHFQAGRGYDKRGKKSTQVSYFEPWNQQRFDPSEPYIARVQWRSAYKSYRANEAHFQHNIGV